MNKKNYSNLLISDAEITRLAKVFYGLNLVNIKRLEGEVDFNFCIKTDQNTCFVLKISRPTMEIQQVEFEAAIIQHLTAQDFPFDLPTIIQTCNERNFGTFQDKSGDTRYIRLQSWITGQMVKAVTPRTNSLMLSWGRVCGHLSKSLQGFDHIDAHRFYKWNPSETLYSRDLATYFQKEEENELAHYFWNDFERNTLPQLGKLRKSVNHNDAHELNLLANNDLYHPQITGVIDFGDALYCETINELAIACAYAGMNWEDPLSAISLVVQGYHEIFPLEEQEIEVLYSLIAARLLITVASAAHNKHLEPENVYLQISERPAWDLLRKWKNYAPSFVKYTLRQACGWSAHPNVTHFKKWAIENQSNFAAVIDFTNQKLVPLDLSVSSIELGNNSRFDTIPNFQKTLNRLLEDKGGDMGVGGYGEIRPIYTTDAFQTIGNQGPQWRTVHLGLDIWAKAGTSVFAPYKGIVHSFKNNDGAGDYGGTIILQHDISTGLTFYTLYGHLSIASLEGLTKGQKIEKGQAIATLGEPHENGGWVSHLHFQVMLDMLGKEGDFPGVAYPHEAKMWLDLCPNPIHLINSVGTRHALSLSPSKSHSSPSINEILNKRKQYLGRSLSISYQKPLHMVRGYKQYLYDETGRRYLDTVNNVAHVGHEHPKVVRAANLQNGVLNTNTRYLHKNIVQFAEELVATLPKELSVVHFVNSGSEANELALRMAEAYTNQQDMIAVEVGYHGNTNRVIDVSSYKFDGKGGKGAPLTTHTVPIPDTYRGKYRNPITAGKKYAAHILDVIKEVQTENRGIAGFICESVLSCGGQVVLPNGYLKHGFEAVRAAGGVCIMDEVQVGFGRVGSHFWGFELQDVVPDIVTMGKPIGNGHPLGAVVTTPEIAEAFANGMEYFNTFGGNPVSCAIGSAVLEVIREENLQEHALEMGNYLLAGLRQLQNEFSIIGDVRGTGLFLGFELVKNRETLEPAPKETAYLANRMRELGFLMSTDGLFHNVIKIKPPMCFDKKNADLLLKYLEMTLGTLS